MEAKVYFEDGRVEAHRIPEFVGGSSTNSPWEGVSETSNVIDTVRGIRESFYRDSVGFWLECTVDKPSGLSYGADGRLEHTPGEVTKRICVVSDDMLGDVRLILLDGEQVYPEEELTRETGYEF